MAPGHPSQRRLALGLALTGLLVVLVLARPLANVAAGTEQLRNDNGQPEGYSESVRTGWVFGSVLRAADDRYPLRVLSVDTLLYRGFQGAAATALVRVGIWSIGADGRPAALLGRSEPVTVGTFYPAWVSIPLTNTQVVLSSPAPFLAGVEYLDGIAGTVPSVLIDSSQNIPVGRNFYSQSHGTSWFEHYQWWNAPGSVGYNMVRATVETRITPVPTWTPTRTLTPTPGPSPTPDPGRVATGKMIATGKQHALARTADGRLHLIFESLSGEGLLHWWSGDDGASWLPQPPVAQLSGLDAALASGPGNTLHLVYGQWDGQAAYHRYYDGQSWQAPTHLGNWAFARNIAVDSRGRVHVVWSNADTWYTRLTGTAWSTPRRIAAGAWHPAIAVGPDDSVHVAYNDNDYCCDRDGVEVRYVRSTDGGDTWSTPQNVSQDGVWSGGAALAVGPDGVVHLTYVSLSPILEGALYYRQWRSGRWSPAEVISSGNAGVMTGSTGRESAAMATDQDGNVFVVYRSLNPAKRWDICLRARDWQGWSPVADLTNNVTEDSGEPAVAYGVVTRGRGLDVAWATADRIVYRHVPLQGFVRPTPTPSLTPTPTPGAYHVRVVDEGGRPVDGARVYHNGFLVTDAAGRPLLTSHGGVLDFPSLRAGDTLAALALLEQRATPRQNHDADADPRYPGQQWAYRLYLTSMSVENDGQVSLYRVPEPGAGEHRLVVKRTNPLVLLNLLISIEWDAEVSYTDEISRAVRLAGDYLYDVTDGQMALGQVAIYDNAARWTDADIQFAAANRVRPYSHIGAILARDTSLTVRLGRQWGGMTGLAGGWDQPAGFRTLVHELGHYALYLGDEYEYHQYTDAGNLSGRADGCCTGPEIKNPDTDDATNASIMDYQYHASELWPAGLNPTWDETCRLTRQWQIHQESDWQTLPRMYADSASPPRWEFITPTLRGGIVAGPQALPLRLPAIQVYNQVSLPPRTLTVYSPWGGRYWGAFVTLYARRGDQDRPIDQGTTNSQGVITLLGAAAGDTVRVASPDAALWGELRIGEATEYSLTLRPVTWPAGAKAPRVSPRISLVPASDGRTLYVCVYGLEGGRRLQATVVQPGGLASQSTELAYSDTAGVYEGSLAFLEAVLGDGDAWVREIGAQDEPLYLYSPFVLSRVSAAAGSDLFSEDGNLFLYVDEGSLPAGEAYAVIMPLSAPPAPPQGLALVGSAYEIKFSGAMTELARPGLLKMRFGPDTRGGQHPQTLGLYAWDHLDSSWHALESALSERDASLVHATRRLGIYALMAPAGTEHRLHLPRIERAHSP